LRVSELYSTVAAKGAETKIGVGVRLSGSALLGGHAGTAAAAVAATLEGAALLFRQAAPDAGIEAGLECPVEAGRSNGAAVADQLGLSDLGKSRAGVTYWEEQLWVFVAANGFVAPIHD